jgi:hypothetical protein
MEKRKLNKSKTTGKGASVINPELSVIVHVRKANYVPEWITLRSKITDLIFTADIKKVELNKLEADEQVTSVSINEQLGSI